MAVLRLSTERGVIALEMQDATSIRYAAMRAAEALGYDPEASGWRLRAEGTVVLIAEDLLAKDFHGQNVQLIWSK